MDEYIKRCKAIAMGFTDGINEDGVLYVPYRDVAAHLKSLPAADVRENVHGKWIPYNALVSDTLCCSECEFNVLPEEVEVYNFCPYCGSDNRGDKNECTENI